MINIIANIIGQSIVPGGGGTPSNALQTDAPENQTLTTDDGEILIMDL